MSRTQKRADAGQFRRRFKLSCAEGPRSSAGVPPRTIERPQFDDGLHIVMVFTKHLREGIRRGVIRCSVRIWTRPHVKVGGRYRMEEGQIVVDSILPIDLADVTDDVARESGFSSVQDLLEIAKHGSGDNVYLIRFHYLPPGGWDVPRESSRAAMSPSRPKPRR